MSNNTNFITTVDIVFASLYSFIVFFGVLGNVIIITIVRKTPSMHTTTNFLLTNLAVADLISLLFCPGFYDFALKSVSLSQPIGDFVCKIFVGNAVLSITILESIFMLVVVAVERYVALVKPFQTNSKLRKENVSFAIAATWTLATLVCIPGILSNNYDERAEKYACNRPWTLNNLEGLKKGLHKGVLFGIYDSSRCGYINLLFTYFLRSLLLGGYISRTHRRCGGEEIQKTPS